MSKSLAPSLPIQIRPLGSKAMLSGQTNQPLALVPGLSFAPSSALAGLPAIRNTSHLKLAAA